MSVELMRHPDRNKACRHQFFKAMNDVALGKVFHCGQKNPEPVPVTEPEGQPVCY